VIDHAPTKRPEIERAALRLFVTRGLRGTTVRDIAAKAGVAEGTLYRHWRSKRDLARSIFRGCAANVADELRRAAARERSAAAKLTAALRALFRAARDDTLLYELLILPPSRETHDFLSCTTTPGDVLAEILDEGRRRGELAAAVDARLVAECLVGAVHRVAIARRLGRLRRPLAAAGDELVRAVATALEMPARRRKASA